MRNLTISSYYTDIPLPKEKTLPELMLRRAKEHDENGKTRRITDTVTGESFDFHSLEAQTRSIASALNKRGFRYGDVAIFLSYDIVKLQLFQLGIWRANGIVRASYPEDDEASILQRVDESRVGWIYCDPEHAEKCLRVAKGVYWDVEVIVTSQFDGCTSIYDLMEDDGSEIPKYILNAEDTAVILNTSGTTGSSKGAVLCHEALMWTINSFSCVCPFGNDAPTLIVSKGTHVTGFCFPYVGILNGCQLLVMHTIRIEYMFEAIHKYKPGHIFAFPTLLVAMVNHSDASKYDFSSLKSASSGGAPVTPAVIKILKQLPNMENVYNTYGLTEVVPLVSSISQDPKAPVTIVEGLPETSTGKLTIGVSAQFRDLESGEILGPFQTGELCVKSKGLFSEYINNPKATKDAFIDGFFKTGDMGYYDNDEFIYLVDRAKEIFKYLGNHVSPTEIENIINDHPAVGEVCVIGVPDPEGNGHLPRAFCVVLQDMDITPQEIIEFTNSKLPDFKHLRGGVYFIPQLPKGKTGKVTRQLVEKLEI